MKKMAGFVHDTLQKPTMSEGNATAITAFSKTKSTELISSFSDIQILEIDDIKATSEMSKVFPFLSQHKPSRYVDAVAQGFISGKQLSKKLSIINDDKTTIRMRTKHGNISRRLLSSASFNSNIFDQKVTQVYGNSYIHISLDGSGSMSGSRWVSALTTATAIAVACDIVGKSHVEIAIRTQMDNSPVSAIVYNSNVDKISKLKNILPMITLDSYTPEGLCFESSMNRMMLNSKKSHNSYFINVSDGEPYGCYRTNTLSLMKRTATSRSNMDSTTSVFNGRNALDFTKKQVDTIKSHGFKVLSYFVTSGKSDGGVDDMKDMFTHMYGKDAFFGDVKSTIILAKSLNNMIIGNK